MNIRWNLSIFLLIVGTLLLVACGNSTNSLPKLNQPDENVSDPISLESFNASETKITTDSLFAKSIAIDGNTAIVGGKYENGSGFAHIFIRSSAGWDQQAKLVFYDSVENDKHCCSVAISGDNALISSGTQSYVFTRSGTTWVQQAKLTGARGDIDGNTVVTDSGYIFTRSGTTWSQQTQLTIGDDVTIQGPVAISGNTVIIGNPQENYHPEETAFEGAAYIFTRSGTNWTQQAKLTSRELDGLGSNVAISEDEKTVVVAGGYESAFGHAYIFTRFNTSWDQGSKITASGVSSDGDGTGFADSVSISGDTVVLGARYEDVHGENQDTGVAYVFTRSGTNWIEQTKLIASDATRRGRFGHSVAISENTTIVAGGTLDSVYAYEFPSENTSEISTVYVSSNSSGNTGNIDFKDEDILVFDINAETWSLYFDGSDVGLAPSDLNAFHLQPDGSILLSLEQSSFVIPNFGTVRASDIVRFIPTSLGETTQGSFEWYFDGSDVGLGSAEGIDAIAFTPEGDLLLSFVINCNVPGFNIADEDLMAFSADSLGLNTAGTWSLYFNGSRARLNDSLENVYGVWLDPDNGDFYLTTKGSFSVSGLRGDADDISIFTPITLGSNTGGSFSTFWNGDQHNFVNEGMDGLFLE